ncbi:hypothetical protein ACFOHK_15510 [Falsigemmobacter intermedius]|uniref:Uncharacterized protein n=1 Tax=Falsigemmobacter intermedius TaxID=1553448 RepID=A0A451GG76_9RHOB|nr:hypothetical protein [Falsigemmobacter intermedius]RWY34543.1 hypothetical protein EP867_19190 [Falsigemmobacter intermedius]
MSSKPDPKILHQQIEKLMSRIAAESDANSLRNIHANISKHPELDDADRERLTEAVVNRLRVVSPKLAKTFGGPKDGPARIFLQKVYEESAERFDLSGNVLKNGVKTGGLMISGQFYLDVYLSYKTASGLNLALTWLQETPDADAILRLSLREPGVSGRGLLKENTFTDQDQAAAEWTTWLEGLIE